MDGDAFMRVQSGVDDTIEAFLDEFLMFDASSRPADGPPPPPATAAPLVSMCGAASAAPVLVVAGGAGPAGAVMWENEDDGGLGGAGAAGSAPVAGAAMQAGGGSFHRPGPTSDHRGGAAAGGGAAAPPPPAPPPPRAKISTQERNREAQRRFRERQRSRVSALERAAADAAAREGVLRAELAAARARIAELEVVLDVQGPPVVGPVLAEAGLGSGGGPAPANPPAGAETTETSGRSTRDGGGAASASAAASEDSPPPLAADAHGVPLASAVAAASAAPTAAAGPTASAAVADALARTLSSTLVLTVDEAGGAVSLSPAAIRALSVDDVAAFHGAYVARLRGLLAELDSSARPAGRAAALATIERLSSESVSLVFRVLLCNPATMIELGARSAGAAGPGEAGQLPPAEADPGWLAVGRAMGLAPPQTDRLLALRRSLVADIAPIRARRVAAVTALASTLGVRLSGYEHMRQTLSASGAVAELRRSLKEEILVRLSCTNELSLRVLTPVQVARALVAAYPRPPDGLAVALWLAAEQGEPDAVRTLAGFGVDVASTFGAAGAAALAASGTTGAAGTGGGGSVATGPAGRPASGGRPGVAAAGAAGVACPVPPPLPVGPSTLAALAPGGVPVVTSGTSW